MTFFAHSHALVDPDAVVGDHTRVWAFAHVLSGAKIGSHCNIGECVFIESGAVLGNGVTIKNGVQIWTGVRCDDRVFVGPNATFTNDLRPRAWIAHDPSEFAQTHVCEGASIGANATIVAGVQIGRFALIGAGAVVLEDVPDHALLVGNPARQIAWVCECAARLTHDLRCPACRREYLAAESGLRRAEG
jgi:UDP-2-acetamido-3-amino-2,3-dideoxy-glucuronate N-acetyltransferase